MPVLEPNRALRSTEPLLKVENDLPPGRWHFRLVVVDNDGVESQPADLFVTIRARPAPTPPDGGGGPRPGGPRPGGPRPVDTGPIGPLRPRDVITRDELVRPIDTRVRRVIIPPR